MHRGLGFCKRADVQRGVYLIFVFHVLLFFQIGFLFPFFFMFSCLIFASILRWCKQAGNQNTNQVWQHTHLIERV